MAKPRVFISSTFYDLKHVRFDLESFIRMIGYDPIMNDKGNIPYPSDRPLESSCYDEVSRCDILVGIIGNKYGSASKSNDEYSVSMSEIKTAIKNNKQVFIFVEKAVLNEYKLFVANKDVSSIKYVAVDSTKIHHFIEEIYSLPMNNALIPFESASDITNYLKEQFAGLFQRLLQEKGTITEQTTYNDLKESIDELKTITKQINSDEEIFWSKFSNSVFSTNLVVKSLQDKLEMKNVSLFIKNKVGIAELLKFMYFNESDEDNLNDDLVFVKNIDGLKTTKVTISGDAFDADGNLKAFRNSKTVENLITVDIEEEELPF